MKLVLDTKHDAGYRDELARRYPFPSQYKRVIDEAVGDWVVFRRPRADGGHMGYIGVGQVERVEPDPETPGRHYAVITNFLASTKWCLGMTEGDTSRRLSAISRTRGLSDGPCAAAPPGRLQRRTSPRSSDVV